jgi:hypothetical protein
MLLCYSYIYTTSTSAAPMDPSTSPPPPSPHILKQSNAPTQPDNKAGSFARPTKPSPQPTKPTPRNTYEGAARENAKSGYWVQENQSPEKINGLFGAGGSLNKCLCRGFLNFFSIRMLEMVKIWYIWVQKHSYVKINEKA